MNEKLTRIVRALSEKNAFDPVVLDIRELTAFTDYFVICHGESSRQVQAICDNIAEKLKASGLAVEHMEGYETANWVLIDCSDVVVHVFSDEKREFYQLEKLWRDAVRLETPLS